jgi:hypothetical protein
MSYLKISIGIFIILASSRFIPHPPNFTTLMTLSFYVPALLGLRFLPFVVISFIITDIFIGLHSITLFTWGSVILIGLLSKFFNHNIFKRITGSLGGCLIFFIVTNFGVWSLGSYGYTLSGLINCFVLAIPFFSYSLISTLIFSIVVETIIRVKYVKKFIFDNSLVQLKI